MVANTWKNSMKNVESDNKKILYETLLDFFLQQNVLTFWISLVQCTYNITSMHIRASTVAVKNQ